MISTQSLCGGRTGACERGGQVPARGPASLLAWISAEVLQAGAPIGSRSLWAFVGQVVVPILEPGQLGSHPIEDSGVGGVPDHVGELFRIMLKVVELVLLGESDRAPHDAKAARLLLTVAVS